MTLSVGSRLGPYEILGPLGAGGMGEVYRARDTRLERTVAIKVLPADLCDSAQARQRFEREAKTISQLSHPHICSLFDASRHDGVDYLVLEYLEGELLSDRLAKGALPLDQTLRFGIQMADALQKAHQHGIVHRDIKPGNVMLTKSGVKLLDFGLAKAEAPLGPQGGLTAMPTRDDLTREGTILGTLQYMAPEQLEGKETDARTDIFALGAVLYEMATGRKAFPGAGQASLISAIMKDAVVPISQISPMIPASLEHAVRTCLAKDPEDRWQSAHDLKTQLRWIDEERTRPGVLQPVPKRRAVREIAAWTLAAVALVLAAAAFVRGARPADGPVRPKRLSVLLPDRSALRAAVISPDGSRIVIVAKDTAGRNLLWVRSLDAPAIQPLPGTDNPSYPFWSPEGRFIGYFADGKLKKIDASGGPPQTVCDASSSRGGTWSRDGTILFAPFADGPLYRVPSTGGSATAVTRLDPVRGETSHRWPYFLPDGRHFLFLVASFSTTREKEGFGIYEGSLDSPEQTLLVRANSRMAYAPAGYLLFAREGNLLAQAFDAKERRVSGDPFPIAETIQTFAQIYDSLFSVSANGILVYQNRTATSIAQLVWVDRAGRRLGLLGTPVDQSNPQISPDGRRVLLHLTDPQSGNVDLWAYDASGGIGARLTSGDATDAGPVWSPDGRTIAFQTNAQGRPDLYIMNSSGTGRPELVLHSEKSKLVHDWSPDGKFLLFRASDAESKLELWTLPLSGDRKPVPFIQAPYSVRDAQFSPDGRYVAYSANESGRWEIHVAPFPGPGGNWRISSDGGSEPRWRGDGKELYYLAPDGTLMAVTVRMTPTFDAESPKPLFAFRRREPVATMDLFTYDVSPDGQRFLVNTDAGDPTTAPLTVTLDWTAGLTK